MTLPVPTVERHGRFWVVRDDVFPGGTKQIILRNMLPELNQKHFVYTASAYGKGGAALAHACAELGFQATLFMAEAKNFRPAWIDEAEKAGAKIMWGDLMPVKKIEPYAWEYAMQNDALYLPLGFDDPKFHAMLQSYVQKLPVPAHEIWCPIVSGTLATALGAAFPDAAIKGVSVVKHHDYKGRGTVHYAPEKFVRVAAIPPPYPSWPYSDAKLWAHAQKHGADDAIIWNTNA